MKTIYKEKTKMIFQDNVIKENLRNVYFISGTPCAGKTTITRALGKKFNIPVYVIDDQFTIHQLMSDETHQPNMNKGFRDADEFFDRSVEEYKSWLLGNSREQLDYVLLDLIKLSQDRVVLCDIHLIAEQAAKITDPSRIAFLIKEPTDLVDAYISRPDHQAFRDFIYSASDYEKAKATCNETLYSLNIDRYNYIRNSDYFWLERDDSRTVDETVALVEKHFGWRLLNHFSVRKVDHGTPLADQLLSFVKNCSWVEVKDHIAEKISKWDFSDWESMFVAVEDDQIIGMASALKEDYYPLPDLFPWISTVFVSEEYRGLRVSEKLIACANDYLRENGFSQSYIPSSHVGLYERYGYFFVKEITNYGGTDDHLYVKIIR